MSSLPDRNDRYFALSESCRPRLGQTALMADSEQEQPPIGLGYKVLAAVGAVVGAKVARKATRKIWRATTGHEPPDIAARRGVSFVETALWTATSAAAIAAAQVTVRRRIAALASRKKTETPQG